MQLHKLHTRANSLRGGKNLLVTAPSRQQFRLSAVAERTPSTRPQRAPGGVAAGLDLSSLQGGQQFNGADDHSEYLYPISDAAALRDGSSTASTSGLDHLSLHLTQAPPQARAQIHGDGILSPEHGSTNGVHSHHLNGSASAMHQLGTPAAAEAVTGDKELYEEIKACEEWADVLDVVADEAKVMSLRTGVQALNRVNTLAKHLPRAQIDLISKHPGFMNLVAIVFSQVESMNPIQLSNSLYAVSQLRVPIPADVLQQYAQTAGVKAKDFWPRDISMFMYALAQLHAQPSRDTLDRLCFRAVGFLSKGEFEPQGISMLLYACVLLGYNNSLLNRAAAIQAGIQLQRFSPQGLANTVWALAHLSFYHKTVVEGALAVIAARPRDFKPQEICNMLWAVTRQRHHPGAAFDPIVKSLLERSSSLTGQDVATVLYSLATFNVAPGQAIMRRLTSTLTSQLSTMTATQVASAYWSLGCLRETHGDVFASLERALVEHHAASPLDESSLRMVFQGFVCAKLSGVERAPEFGALMLDAMKRAWIGAAATSNKDSAVLDVLVDILKQLKVRHDSRRPTRDGLVQIDIALKPSAERFIALQVVVEEDRAINTGQLLATAVFQKEVLERNGWEVKHLPVRDLQVLSDPRLQPLFVAELLKSMGIKAKAIPKESLEAAKAIQNAAKTKQGSDESAAAASSRGGKQAGSGKMSETDLLMKHTQPSGPQQKPRRSSSA